MALFISTFVNKIDKKGRVSVPATFRAALANQSFAGIYVYKSLTCDALEGCGSDHMDMLGESLTQLDPFSVEYEDLSMQIFGLSSQLPFDGEGRVILPQHLMEAAGITDSVAFVGKGRTFQLWEPEAFRVASEEARRRTLQNRPSLLLRPGTSAREGGAS